MKKLGYIVLAGFIVLAVAASVIGPVLDLGSFGDGGSFAPYGTSATGDTDPEWSPDGSRIAFVRVGKQYKGQIYVVDSDGSDVHNVTDADSPGSPTWSPDSKRLAFADLYGLYVVDANGGDPRRIHGGDYHVSGLDWSPNGEWIAVGGGTLVESDGHGTRRVRARLTGAHPDWSPNGRSIAFDRTDDRYYGIYIERVADGKVRRLVRAAERPAWSPDGSEVAFIRGAGAIYIVSVESSRVTRIPIPRPGVAEEFEADRIAPDGLTWSPDGKSIVFSEEGRLFAVRVTGGSAKPLTDGGF
jgi:Tol biopolymer transport system component